MKFTEEQVKIAVYMARLSLVDDICKDLLGEFLYHGSKQSIVNAIKNKYGALTASSTQAQR